MKYLLLLFCLTGISVARKLPSYIEVCRPKHTNVDECIKRNMENLKLKIRDGIPEMRIPAFYPFVIPHADIKLGQDFGATLKNMRLYLNQSFVVEDIKTTLDNFQIHMNILFPYVYVITDYSVKGKLLIFTLDGSGFANFNVTNVRADVITSGKKEMRNGKEYVKLNEIIIKSKLDNISILMDNLFPNNKDLTDSANKVFNENQEVLVEDFTPIITNVAKTIVNNMLTNFFDRYSFDVLFPDD